MNRLVSLIGSIGLGAGLMYYFDPDRGRRRRILVQDRAVKLKNQADDFLDKAARDLSNRTRGAFAEAASVVSRKETPDWIIEERVRAEIGRVSRHPGAIEVMANQGTVTLRGPILAQDVERVITRASSVRGVKKLENQMEVHEKAGDVPGLQGNPPKREIQFELMQENWSPSARLLAGIGGGMLAVYGRSRRGLIGGLASLAGLGLLARGVTNLELKRLLGFGGGRRAVDIHKAINIDASPERLYEFWNHFENFPLFMSHVKEVRDLGDGKSHWKVAGPAGVPVEFDAVITKQVPNQLIAWKSLPGETVKSAGIVRFDPNPDGGTRVSVQMSYNPPAGALGHTVASIFGADPKQAMDEDLARLKSLFEVGKTSVDGREVTREDIVGAMGAAQA